jgi:hypothetical protein
MSPPPAGWSGKSRTLKAMPGAAPPNAGMNAVKKVTSAKKKRVRNAGH